MPHITEMTEYKFGDLRECIVDLFNALRCASTHPQQAIYTKYSQPKQVLFCIEFFVIPSIVMYNFTLKLPHTLYSVPIQFRG